MDWKNTEKFGNDYNLEIGLGFCGQAEWKLETSSSACLSSVVGSQDNSSSVFL